MGFAKTSGQALGKLFKNVQKPQWYFSQAAQAVVTIYVINPLGQKVWAYLKGHLHLHDEKKKDFDVHKKIDKDLLDEKIGDVYHCSDGHEYIHVNGKTCHYDSASDTWTDRTH